MEEILHRKSRNSFSFKTLNCLSEGYGLDVAIATSRIRFGLAFQENYSYFCAKGELKMIGYKRTKQECKGEQAAKVSKKLTLDKTRKNTGDAVKMPEKFSVVWK